MFSRAIKREVIILLAVKALALTLLYVLFFNHAPVVTPTAVQQQLSR